MPSDGSCTTVDPTRRKADLITQKATRTSANSHGKAAANAGGFAYASAPVDYRGPGPYTFQFGPLATDFNYPASPSGVTFDFPADFPGRIRPSSSHAAAIVADGKGERDFEVTFEISGDATACSNLVILLY